MRLKSSQAARYLAYSERKLADATDDTGRAMWQEKIRFYEHALKGRCRRCGRKLVNPTAVYGSECIKHIDPATFPTADEQRADLADLGMYDEVAS